MSRMALMAALTLALSLADAADAAANEFIHAWFVDVPGATDLEVGDVNGDGIMDVVVIAHLRPSYILASDGRGTFEIVESPFVGDNGAGIEVVLADLDLDLDLDAFFGGLAYEEFWINQGGNESGAVGTFVETLPSRTPATWLKSRAAVGDINGDGFEDIVRLGTYSGSSLHPSVWTNDHGKMVFSHEVTSLSTPGGWGAHGELADFDGDEDLDLLVLDSNSVYQVLVNQGNRQGGASGTFGQLIPVFTIPFSYVYPAVGDLDDDGDIDLAARANGNAYQVFFNTSQNTGEVGFVTGTSFGTTSNSNRRLAAGDLDMDGDQDIYAMDGNWDEVWVNQGHAQGGTLGEFQAGPAIPGYDRGGAWYYTLRLADMDGDGDLDAVTADGTGVHVLLNQTVLSPPNHRPVTSNDYAVYRALPGTTPTLGIPVLRNDTDADGDALQIVRVGPPATGMAEIYGRYVGYTAQAGSATDRFDYVVSDGIEVATGTVAVAIAFDGISAPPAATDDTAVYTVSSNIFAEEILMVLTNDVDPDTTPLDIIAAVSSHPSHLHVETNAGGRGTHLAYAPSGLATNEQLAYTVSDGEWLDSAVVDVNMSGNMPPVAVPDQVQLYYRGARGMRDGVFDYEIEPLVNDFDPDGDPITIAAKAEIRPGEFLLITNDSTAFPDETDRIIRVRESGNLTPFHTLIDYTISDGFYEVSARIDITPRAEHVMHLLADLNYYDRLNPRYESEALSLIRALLEMDGNARGNAPPLLTETNFALSVFDAWGGDWLDRTRRGNAFVEPFESHLLEIVTMVLDDPSLTRQLGELALLWQPLLRSLVEDDGSAIVTQEHVDWLRKVFAVASRQSSFPLRKALADFLTEWPELDGLVGHPISEVQTLIFGLRERILRLILLDANRFALDYEGDPELTHRVQYSTDLREWVDLTAPTSGAPGTIAFPVSTNSALYFREVAR